MPIDWESVRLTLELATVTTAILLLIGTPLAWWLARSKARWKEAVAALVALPLVLPPTVLGFYLLIALGPNGPGGWLAGLWGARSLAFSFPGLVIGSVVFSLPFVVQPIRNAFEAIGERPLEAAATLGAGPWDRFWSVAVPLARPDTLKRQERALLGDAPPLPQATYEALRRALEADDAHALALCRRIVILEKGRIVETGDTKTVLKNPQHPYTQRLLASVPRLSLNEVSS